jgi:hypothetical protein
MLFDFRPSQEVIFLSSIPTFSYTDFSKNYEHIRQEVGKNVGAVDIFH